VTFKSLLASVAPGAIMVLLRAQVTLFGLGLTSSILVSLVGVMVKLLSGPTTPSAVAVAQEALLRQ